MKRDILIPVGERHRPLHQASARRGDLEELEDALVRADLGVATALRITKAVRHGRYDKEIAPDEVRASSPARSRRRSMPVAMPWRSTVAQALRDPDGRRERLRQDHDHRQARRRSSAQQGLSVMLAAGDTFRAAAIEQLKVWGERVGAPVIARAARRGRGGPRLRRPDGGEGAAVPTCSSSTPPGGCRTRPG